MLRTFVTDFPALFQSSRGRVKIGYLCVCVCVCVCVYVCVERKIHAFDGLKVITSTKVFSTKSEESTISLTKLLMATIFCISLLLELFQDLCRHR